MFLMACCESHHQMFQNICHPSKMVMGVEREGDHGKGGGVELMSDLLTIKVTEKEARTIGEQRWQKKHQKKLVAWAVFSFVLIIGFWVLGIFAFEGCVWAQWFALAMMGLGFLSGFVLTVFLWIKVGRAGKVFVEAMKNNKAEPS